MYNCIIKWTGSKKSQSKEILKHFPEEIDTYYEPFVGGGSVLYELINSDIKVKKYICSDINLDLINLWNTIKYNHVELIEKYNELWSELNKDKDLDRQKTSIF